MVEPIADHTEVRFGHRVTVETEGGKRRTFRIVGEDQADPAKGMVPYVAPIFTALLGKSVGDTVESCTARRRSSRSTEADLVAHPDAARAGGIAVLVEDRLALEVADGLRLDILDARRPLIEDDRRRRRTCG